MNELSIMNINGIECYEENGTAYLKLEAVARGLGFTQAKNGAEYVRWETVNGYLEELGFPNKLGKSDFIPENIFYRLAMKAKNEAAEQFQAKIADEVIPAIRRTGGYMIAKDEPPEVTLSRAIMIAQETIERQNEKIKRLSPAAEYANRVLLAPNGVLVSSIAKEYGMGAAAFNKLLAGLGVQYKRGGQWLLYADYQDKGYTVTKTNMIPHSDGTLKAHPETLWTQRGRVFLFKLLERHGIKPFSVEDQEGA